MADDSDAIRKAGAVQVIDAPHAPFIFFENAPALGFTNGIVNITLAANRTTIGPDGIVTEKVVTAYLRGNVQAALNLRAAIDDALLLGEPVAPTAEGKAN